VRDDYRKSGKQKQGKLLSKSLCLKIGHAINIFQANKTNGFLRSACALFPDRGSEFFRRSRGTRKVWITAVRQTMNII
jgi:hypothetical protein